MKISKRDALLWFSFFAQLDEDEPLMPRQQELVLATLSQIELAQEKRIADLRAQIPGLQTIAGRRHWEDAPISSAMWRSFRRDAAPA